MPLKAPLSIIFFGSIASASLFQNCYLITRALNFRLIAHREGDEIVVLQVGATYSEDEPQESVSRAMFSSMVQPYLVHGTAVFLN